MKKNILVITTGGNKNRTKASKYLSEALKAKKVDFDFVDPSQIVCEVSSSVGHDKIYIRTDKKDGADYSRVYSKKYDAVIVRASKGINYVANILRHLEKNIGVYCSASGDGILNASKKFVTHQIISAAGCVTPKTVLVSNPKDFNFLTSLVGGLPCVCKTARGGSGGIGTMILETPLAASTMLETFSKKKIPLLIQEFIETADADSEKFDIRLIVVGDQVVSAMKRYSIKGDFRSNFTKSKSAETYKPTKEQNELAVKTAKALKLPFCGVDIAVDSTTGKNYVIEGNSNPGAGIIGITEKNHFIDLVDYVLEQSKSKSKMSANMRYDDDLAIQSIINNSTIEVSVLKEADHRAEMEILYKEMIKTLDERITILER